MKNILLLVSTICLLPADLLAMERELDASNRPAQKIIPAKISNNEEFKVCAEYHVQTAQNLEELNKDFPTDMLKSRVLLHQKLVKLYENVLTITNTELRQRFINRINDTLCELDGNHAVGLNHEQVISKIKTLVNNPLTKHIKIVVGCGTAKERTCPKNHKDAITIDSNSKMGPDLVGNICSLSVPSAMDGIFLKGRVCKAELEYLTQPTLLDARLWENLKKICIPAATVTFNDYTFCMSAPKENFTKEEIEVGGRHGLFHSVFVDTSNEETVLNTEKVRALSVFSRMKRWYDFLLPFGFLLHPFMWPEVDGEVDIGNDALFPKAENITENTSPYIWPVQYCPKSAALFSQKKVTLEKWVPLYRGFKNELQIEDVGYYLEYQWADFQKKG